MHFRVKGQEKVTHLAEQTPNQFTSLTQICDILLRNNKVWMLNRVYGLATWKIKPLLFVFQLTERQNFCLPFLYYFNIVFLLIEESRIPLIETYRM